ncbi:hypothetical protein PJF56_21680 [Roseofilum sp. BLCC_M91]|uniref:GNAT family N-acetyltransferase n=1 Tax=Roseofilum halophilum BLCC-M91 TaxID=3022259 RepID=A0ABT7BQM0_9CYAN|nr:hypothetical protein [Roseofilum halophilum]MDJ1181480.1 hypothetical protein [Roseofilum halophilum BLCC-M91]
MFNFSKKTSYTCRLATLEDAAEIAPLWAKFAQEREMADPALSIKSDFDFQAYIAQQLNRPLSYGWVLEDTQNSLSIVGCLLVYCYDEAPPPDLPLEWQFEHELNNPFKPRRVGSVLGLYIEPEYRNPQTIQLLTDAALDKAYEMKVSHLDILVSGEQTGMQAFLSRSGFTKAAVQYTKELAIIDEGELPNLHPPHPELKITEESGDRSIPLYDPQTQELVRNPDGEPVFLTVLRDEDGIPLTTSAGLPIYANPVRHPQTQDWVFDRQGQLLVCPVLQDDRGQVVELQGIPQFYPPDYEMVNGQLRLKQDEKGNYLFCDVERDREGTIVLSPDGSPLFKPVKAISVAKR